MARQEKAPRHPTAIYFARKSRGMTRTELARKTGINAQTIQKLEHGMMRVARKWTDKLARPLGYTSEQLMYWDRFFPEGVPTEHVESGAIAIAEEDDDGPAVVRLVGYVAAGAEAHYYAIAQGDLDLVSAPKNATKNTVAVEIRGKSLGAIFDRWLVYYDDVRRPVTPDLIGKLCILGLPDNRVLIKQIRRGAHGLFDLYSEHEEPIRGVGIEWAAKVISIDQR